MGWALTRIKAEVTEQQDRLFDSFEMSMSNREAASADEIVTVEELIELANSIALDHYEHVYIEQFE